MHLTDKYRPYSIDSLLGVITEYTEYEIGRKVQKVPEERSF